MNGHGEIIRFTYRFHTVTIFRSERAQTKFMDMYNMLQLIRITNPINLVLDKEPYVRLTKVLEYEA